jgi:hypothetical protein
MRYKLLRCAAITTSLLAPATASATQIYVSGDSLPNGYEIATFQPVDASSTWGGGTEYTGEQALSTNLGTIYAWCVDVSDIIYLGSDNILYTQVPLDVNGATEIAEIATWGTEWLNKYGPSNLISAAVQAEIWDLEYHVELAPGSDKALVKAVTWVDDKLLPTLTPVAGGYELSGYFNDGDGPLAQILYSPPTDPPKVATPEPASIAMLSVGLVALLGIRRVRRPA